MNAMKYFSLLFICLTSALTFAQRPPPAPAPATDLAMEAAQKAIAVCSANGFNVAVSVVDAAGGVRVLAVADGAGARLGTPATRKATAAVTFGLPTATLEEQVKTDAALAARFETDAATLYARAGGLPLIANGEVIGAIGVGGAPDGMQDEICAAEAVAAIQDRL